MKNLIKKLPHNEIALFAILFFLFGLLYSRAFMSIGMMILLGNAILNYKIKENFKSLLSDKYLLLFSSVFLLFALSGLWSQNWHEFYDRTRVKTPYMVLPLGFVIIKQWRKQYYHIVFAFFVFIVCCGILYSLSHYYADKQHIDQAYGFAQVMPTPFKNDHIRFSMAVVISTVLSAYLAWIQKKWSRWLWLSLALLQFVFLHVLAVKTGLLSLYFICVLSCVYYVVFTKKYIVALLSILVIGSIPFFMYHFSKSFKNKFNYTKYSVERMFDRNYEMHYSDEGRLLSYKIAKQIIADHPVLGVGAGDVMQEMQKAYTKNGIATTKTLLPHNQFLMFFCACGVFGFLTFGGFVFYPLFIGYRKKLLFVSVWLVLFTALMIEPLLETQYGVAIHIFFLLLLLNYLAPTND